VRPVTKVRVGPTTGAWDPARTQTLRPYNRTEHDEYVLGVWPELAGTGHTDREVVVSMEDVPALIDDLAAAYAGYARRQSEQSTARRIETARAEGYADGWAAHDAKVEVTARAEA
jgi:hypothetical protein